MGKIKVGDTFQSTSCNTFTVIEVKNQGNIVIKFNDEFLDSINYLHPFREGNGRAQREFLRLLAQEKGLTLNLNPPDSKSVYERYMKGTIESDIQTLTELIYALITQI